VRIVTDQRGQNGTVVIAQGEARLNVEPLYLSMGQVSSLGFFLQNVVERALAEWLCADEEVRLEMERIAYVRNHGGEE
jgi:uncharacterized membrane protein